VGLLFDEDGHLLKAGDDGGVVFLSLTCPCCCCCCCRVGKQGVLGRLELSEVVPRVAKDRVDATLEAAHGLASQQIKGAGMNHHTVTLMGYAEAAGCRPLACVGDNPCSAF
jgi:hypothetical protein